MTGRWNPRGEPAVARARRAATLSSLRAGTAGLARRQRARDGRWSAPAQAGPGAADASWTTARILAVNLIVLCGLAAVVISISSVLEHITRQAVFVVFLIVTLFLIRRGSRLRRRGFERLGRSITAWAGLTGSLVVVSGVLSLDLTQFIPELIALCAGWLLVLGVWKDLDRLVTAAVLLVGPVVWGAFVWNRSLAGAVLIVIAAGAYARSGNVHRGLFGALVGSSVLVIVAGVHQLSHARGVNAFDAADLLALLIIVVCLVAAGEL